VAIAGIALLAAACGSSSPTTSTSSNGGSAGPADPGAAAFKFAECMRQHGVTNFPDPVVSSHGGETSVRMVAPASVAGSPAALAARKACQGILPIPSPAELAQQQHQREQNLLAFAHCMRRHGVNDFPDPTSQGQLTIEMLATAGIDLHAPGVKTTGLSCVSASGGAVTRAEVIAATTGSG